VQVNWSKAGQAGWHTLDMTGADQPRLRAARRWAAATLVTLDEPHRIDMLMVVGELLENAYSHAGGPRQLRIHHAHDLCEVTVAVADAGPGEPRLRDPDLRGGRGLLLVDQLCSAWGVSYHDAGKLVWGRLVCEESEGGVTTDADEAV
jgi:anti-sigma regulatory factor (Ser/Thr protein kinase)